MILDRLVEKKDIQAYISWRIKILKIEMGKIPDIEKPRRRETAKRQIIGRIKELNLMKEVIRRGAKSDSIIACKNYHIALKHQEKK
jgi:hypothetical protein